MPVDPSIALQIKSPVIETPDFNKTFQTLSYMRSQIANARAKEEEAARAQERCQALEAENAQLKGLS